MKQAPYKDLQLRRTEAEDESLFSNAQGTPNSKAPGAHRLRVDLVLSRYGYDEEVADFVELAKVKDGRIQSMVTQSTYNILEDSMAQRTYETNGDYNVSTHQIDLREHLQRLYSPDRPARTSETEQQRRRLHSG
ncbi:hypothetical protein [Escherichia phage vB_EcoM-ZQ1]|nr:hypothetical protein [Escherichia phage vB_EcoM-ZQ1]